MTDAEIQEELQRHAKRIEQAEREGWFLKPISLDEKAFNLRMQQLHERSRRWFESRRKRVNG